MLTCSLCGWHLWQQMIQKSTSANICGKSGVKECFVVIVYILFIKGNCISNSLTHEGSCIDCSLNIKQRRRRYKCCRMTAKNAENAYGTLRRRWRRKHQRRNDLACLSFLVVGSRWAPPASLLHYLLCHRHWQSPSNILSTLTLRWTSNACFGAGKWIRCDSFCW